jgi:hypothetical protein
VHAVVQEDNFMGIPLERLRGKKQDAFIGYLSFNLYNPPKEAAWGRYNDRVVNADWVSKLVESFTKHLDNCTNEDALEVVVKKTWIQNMDAILTTVNDKKIEDVPKMEFTPDGKSAIDPENLVMLGGNHRRLALKVYVDNLKNQLEKDENTLKAKTTQAHKHSDITGPIGAELEEVQKKVIWVEQKIASSQHWVVALYDIGTQYYTDLSSVCTDIA